MEDEGKQRRSDHDPQGSGQHRQAAGDTTVLRRQRSHHQVHIRHLKQADAKTLQRQRHDDGGRGCADAPAADQEQARTAQHGAESRDGSRRNALDQPSGQWGCGNAADRGGGEYGTSSMTAKLVRYTDTLAPLIAAKPPVRKKSRFTIGWATRRSQRTNPKRLAAATPENAISAKSCRPGCCS